MDESRGLTCVWSDPSDHPRCPHGPTLLFAKYINGEIEQFYACSACRDRKLCKFYLKHGEELTKEKKALWEQERKKYVSSYPHQKLFILFNELSALNAGMRCYCHTCEKLLPISEKNKHDNHEILEGLTDHQMNHPTEILKPLDNAKKEAQYLFSKKATEDITNMLSKLGAKQVLCIGTPRVHEYVSQNFEDKMSSLLLDFDPRFHNFYGPLNYCWYNLFNHHFFNESASNVFKDFLTQNEGKDTFLICDPPFGGRVEAMSWTIKRISELHKKWNKIEDDSDSLKIIFVLPYFMESVMKRKSNPPSVPGGLKDLKMSDYKVDYDNHPLFVTDKKGNKQPSPARIFTNIPLHLLELPESDGYKYCKRCRRWVASENKHCKKCKECTSKDGRRYRHCNICLRCVKPTWKHCNVCNRCALENHTCGQKPKVTGRCFKCDEYGHLEEDCSFNQEDQSHKIETKKSKKRKINSKEEVTRQELDGTPILETEDKKDQVEDETLSSKRGGKRRKIIRTGLKVKRLKGSKLSSKTHKKIMKLKK